MSTWFSNYYEGHTDMLFILKVGSVFCRTHHIFFMKGFVKEVSYLPIYRMRTKILSTLCTGKLDPVFFFKPKLNQHRGFRLCLSTSVLQQQRSPGPGKKNYKAAVARPIATPFVRNSNKTKIFGCHIKILYKELFQEKNGICRD